jgi:AraC-like DNA-binding protein
MAWPAGRKIRQTTASAIRIGHHRYQHGFILPSGYDNFPVRRCAATRASAGPSSAPLRRHDLGNFLAARLALSPSQLRRRCLHTVGMSPKALQRTLRFQGFLALAQAGVTATGTAGLAADAGYADQAHLNRECLRLTGLTPRDLLGGSVDRCLCGHDHLASYRPFLSHARFVQDGTSRSS